MTAAPNSEIEPIENGWRELAALIDSLGPEGRELKGGERWAVKDHLAHIAAWEQSLRALLAGEDMRTAMGVPDASVELDALNEAIWLAHRHDTAGEVLDYSRRSHEALMARLASMSDADLRRSYNHYQPNDPRDPGDDRPVVEWVAGDTYDHYREHIGWIGHMLKDSRASR